MREIKYKVWNEELKEMYVISKEKYLGSTGVVDPYVGHEKAVWLQFTGLTDVNSREIYEGDILKWDGNRIKESKLDSDYLIEVKLSDYLTIELVEYTNKYMFGYDTDGYDFPHFLKEAEVIGNIYQHSHLLKENEQ